MRKRFRLNWGKGAKLKVERLLEGGIDVDGPMDNYGYCLLHHAVVIENSADESTKKESEAIAKILIDKGANVDSQDYCGRTPLMLAVESYNINVVRLLLEKGSSVNVCCKYGKSVLHYTVYNPGTDAADIVLKKGARKDITDHSGENPLEEASKLDNNIIVQFLEKSGAQCNRIQNDGVTLLHRTAFWGKNKQMARSLVKGCNIEEKDKRGINALIIAVRSGKYETVKMLLDSGADISVCDNSGNSVLHWASKQCLGDIVRLLLQYGASPLVTNKAQETPFDKAVEGLTGDSKMPLNSVYLTCPVISHLLDYGFCRHIDTAINSPNGHRSERDAMDFMTPFAKIIIANDLRRSLAGLPNSNSLYPFTLEHGLHFLSPSLKKQLQNMDSMKKKSNPQFCTDCKREIAIMKTISLTSKITLFDVLTKPVEQVITYLSLETIEHLLISDDCADDLPIYWGMVQSKLEILFYTKSLINSAQILFTYMHPTLPYDCIEIIVNYLSLNDLKLLCSISYTYELGRVVRPSSL